MRFPSDEGPHLGDTNVESSRSEGTQLTEQNHTVFSIRYWKFLNPHQRLVPKKDTHSHGSVDPTDQMVSQLIQEYLGLQRSPWSALVSGPDDSRTGLNWQPSTIDGWF